MGAQWLDVPREESAPIFEVKEKDPQTGRAALVGRLTVSIGGVRWAPTGTKGDAYFLNWKDFDALMQKQIRA
jgi:hypothetical protein